MKKIASSILNKILTSNNLTQALFHYTHEKELKNLNPYDRCISLVRNFTENIEFINALKLEINTLYSKEEKSLKAFKLKSILNDFTKNELKQIEISLKAIYKFNQTDLRIRNRLSIIENQLFFPITVITFSFETWKKIIYYELQIIKDENNRLFQIESYINQLYDLEYRLGGVILPKLYIELKHSYERNSNYIYLHPSFNLKKETLNQYVKYLKEIDLKELKKVSFSKLNDVFQKELQLKKQLQKNLKKSKFNLIDNKKLKQVKKGFNYLIKLQNNNLSKKEISVYTETITNSLFNNSLISKKEPQRLNLTFSKTILIDYILYLEKKDFFDQSEKYSVPKILHENFPIEYNKGFSKKNIYVIINKRKNNNLKFDNLTSEIRLKNEMIF
uniref:hypothetical protein n=1 Tax=uncultured Tenacibaculum sp. TaxID=174713 RepID=UPI002614DB22|nr:hypothetical protein [uncultured Tenacibaculum sp.]